MQRAEEGGEWNSLSRCGRAQVGGSAGEPGNHAPVPWVVRGWKTDPEGKWHRQRKSRGDTWKPYLLVLDKPRADSPTWQTDGEIITKTIHHIVPADVEETQGKTGKIRMLTDRDRFTRP